MVPRTAMIVGGSRDGEIVPFSGRVYRAPRKLRVSAIYTDESPSPGGGSFVIDEYDLCWWDDGREWAARYVLREMVEGLGADGR